jgi:hypothetical protein
VAGAAAGELASASLVFLLFLVFVVAAEASPLAVVWSPATALSAAAFSFFAFFFAALDVVSVVAVWSPAASAVARSGVRASVNMKQKTAIHKVSLFLE